MSDEITKPTEDTIIEPPVELSTPEPIIVEPNPEPSLVTSPSSLEPNTIPEPFIAEPVVIESIPESTIIKPTIESIPEPISEPVIIEPTLEESNPSSLEPISEPVPVSIPPVIESKIETPISSVNILQPNTTNPTQRTDSVIESKFKANMARARELLAKANIAIQFKRKKKLDKIMTLFDKKHAPTHIGNQIGVGEIRIKNADVRDLLHVSDPTATNYLNILVKEGKLKKEGKRNSVNYIKNE